MKKLIPIVAFLAAIVSAMVLGLTVFASPKATSTATSSTSTEEVASTTTTTTTTTPTSGSSKKTSVKDFEKPLTGQEREQAVKENGIQLEQAVKSLHEKDDTFSKVPMTFDGASVFSKFAEQADLKKVGADYVYPFPYDRVDGGTVKGAVINNTLRDVSYAIMVYDFVVYHMEIGQGSGIYLVDLIKGNEALSKQFGSMMSYFDKIRSGEKDEKGCYGISRAVCTHSDDPSGTLYVSEEFRGHAEELATLVNTMTWVGPVHGQTVGNYRLIHGGDLSMQFPAWYDKAEFQYEGDFVCFAFYWKGFGSLKDDNGNTTGMAASYVYFNVNDRRIAIVKEVEKRKDISTPTPTPTPEPEPEPTPEPPTPEPPTPEPPTPEPPTPEPPTPEPPTPTPEPEPEPVKDPADDPVNNGNADQGGGDNQPTDGSGPYEPKDPDTSQVPAEQHFPESAAVTKDDQGTPVDHVDENLMNDSLDYADGAVKADDYAAEGSSQGGPTDVNSPDSNPVPVDIPTTKEESTPEQDKKLEEWNPDSIGA